VNNDVMVLGGGIAGIQASLDLAEMGIQVHLVETLPCIGGNAGCRSASQDQSPVLQPP
jgi:heterodisulfide reductase subunit A